MARKNQYEKDRNRYNYVSRKAFDHQQDRLNYKIADMKKHLRILRTQVASLLAIHTSMDSGEE